MEIFITIPHTKGMRHQAWLCHISVSHIAMEAWLAENTLSRFEVPVCQGYAKNIFQEKKEPWTCFYPKSFCLFT